MQTPDRDVNERLAGGEMPDRDVNEHPAGEQMPDRDVNERPAGEQMPDRDVNECLTGKENIATGGARETSGATVQRAARREAAGMRRKQKRARANSIFWTVSLTVGVLLFGLVFVVSKHQDELDCKERLVTTFEFFKTQTSAYSKYNDTAVAKSLVRESAAVHALERDCTLDASEAELRQYTETLWMTGVALLDPAGGLVSEYTEDDVGYEAIRGGLPDIATLGLVDAPDKTYVKRVELPDGSFADVALHALSAGDGILLAYRHTKEAFAQKSVLSMQTLLDGYDRNTVGTFLLVRSNVVEASNDPAMIGVDVTRQGMLRGIRATNQSEKLTFVLDGRGAKYYGMYTHGRDFVLYAYVPARNIYRSMMPNLAVLLILYIVVIALIQGLRWNGEQKFRKREVEAERAYKEALEKKNHELELAVQQEAAANRAKRDFLFNMSHDIRTPMNAVIGMTEIAKQHLNEPAYVKDCLEKVSLAGNHLLTLINDILDISKIESGRMTLDPVPFSLRESVDEMVAIVRQTAAENQLGFAVQIHDVTQDIIVADPLRLRQILLNLLGNAVKYTEPGGHVRFDVSEKAVPGRTDRTRLQFIIADDGIGMSEEFQKTMYTSFSRATDSRINKIQGSGLGLAIARQMTELMGGEIQCESAPGRGTTFRVVFELPTASALPMQPAPRTEADGTPGGLAGMRVLAAEDNDLNWEIIHTMLEEYGIVSDRAENGQICLDILHDAAAPHYDIVLMDVQMPVMDGREATRRLRADPDPALRDLPIVAMTADAFAEDVAACREAGMDAHIAKPVDIKQVLRTLKLARDGTLHEQKKS